MFGDSIMPEIATPKLPSREEWTLTENWILKEVTGMFMSGHPLDHFKFELKYYGIMQLSEFKRSERLSNAYSRQRQPQFSYCRPGG